MASDTTRKVDFTREQCGLPPLDSWEAIARELLRWRGHSGTLPDAARHWIVDTVENIPPTDDQAAITSLQRELAEARGERDNLKSAIASHREHSVDCGRTLWRHDRELWDAQSAPAPSDVKGEETVEPASGEPWLKPLPEGARVIVQHDMTAPRFKVPYLDGYWQLTDSSLYGIPDGERVKELEAVVNQQSERLNQLVCACGTAEQEVERLTKDSAAWERATSREAASRHNAWIEAERLRKAIKRAIYALEACGISGTIEAQQSLLAALAPSPAASGEKTMKPMNMQELREHCYLSSQFAPKSTPAPAAESEGVDFDVRSSTYRATCVQRDQALARLAACEERCKSLEQSAERVCGLKWAIRDNGIRGSHLVVLDRAISQLESLLAPKAGGERATIKTPQ